MPDERENGIHWSVTVQEASKIMQSAIAGGSQMTPSALGAAVVLIAKDIWQWRMQVAEAGNLNATPPVYAPPAPTPPPAPPESVSATPTRTADVPYDQEQPPPAQQEGGYEEPHLCLCGSKQYFDGTKGSNGAWFCHEKKKSHDPVIQAEQSALHPPDWIG